MKLKNGEIYIAYNALALLSNEKLPIKTAHGLAKLSIKLEFDFKAIEKIRLTLVKELGVEKNGICTVLPEKRNEFQIKLDELFGLETEVGEITKVKLPETLMIEASILVALDKFVEV